MTVRDVLEILEKWLPAKNALPGDNVGLLVGDSGTEVTKILVCLDCTSENILYAKSLGANLIVTHHPVIYAPLKNVTESSRAFKLIKNGIACISCHTNLDMAKGGVNDCLCNALGIKNLTSLYEEDSEFFSNMGELENALSSKELAKHVKNVLGGNIRYSIGKNPIKKVAVCSGAGGSMLEAAILSGCDALITADVKHSLFITAAEHNFTLIDAGHYHTENLIVKPLAKFLFENTDLPVETSDKNAVFCL